MTNDQRHKEDLEFLLEICEQAHLQSEKHKALIARIANKRIKPKAFLKEHLSFAEQTVHANRQKREN